MKKSLVLIAAFIAAPLAYARDASAKDGHAHICRNCGKIKTAEWAAKTKARNLAARAAGTALLLVACLLFSGIANAAPDVKFDNALEALQTFRSAFSVGLNNRDYASALIPVKVAVDKLGDDPKYQSIKRTTQMLIDANMIWNLFITNQDATVLARLLVPYA